MRLEVRVFPEFGQPVLVEAEHLSVEVVQNGELHRLRIFGEEYEALVPRIPPKPFIPRMVHTTARPNGYWEEEPPKGISVPVDKLEIHLHGERSRKFLFAFRHQE